MVDTNIFIYAHDPRNADKQKRVIALIADLAARQELIISAQVLNEFYVRATRPNLPPMLTHEQAQQILVDIIASATVLPLTASITLLALEAVAQYGMAFWDALIWAVAKENGDTVIYTEDTPSASEIEGIRYVNPFNSSG